MYAIVEIAGKQYKIEKDVLIDVDRLGKEPGEVTFDKVLLFSDGDKIEVGQPYVKNVQIKADLVGEVKGTKVRGIRFKKRKNYTRTLGHRQTYSRIRIKEITAG